MKVAKKKVLFCFGTRPEAIKLAPVVREFQSRLDFEVKVCVTSQHRQMLDQVLHIFDIRPDYDLDVMTHNQTLEQLTGKMLVSISNVLTQVNPECVIVQGDTTTTFAAALAAYYKKISVAHVEAGLRTHHKYAPFPEEINRRMTACLTDWHFPPTNTAKEALLKENIPTERIFVVGNSVIDALLSVVDSARRNDETISKRFTMLGPEKRMILITGHRRENFGDGFLNICGAIRSVALSNADVELVYPVHLNPNVQEPVNDILAGISNVHLIPPQDYLTFVWLLDRSHIVLTDSGGVQEEAPSLGKPVMVMRETTERPEAVIAGVASLVGTDQSAISSQVQQLLDDPDAYKRMSRAQNPYGDGTSSVQIADVLSKELN